MLLKIHALESTRQSSRKALAEEEAPARTYACNDHDSHYPVGCASVVVAENEEQARELLDAQLVANGLKPHKLAPYTLREVKAGEAVVLANGVY